MIAFIFRRNKLNKNKEVNNSITILSISKRSEWIVKKKKSVIGGRVFTFKLLIRLILKLNNY